MYKHDFINLISIIESLILESATNISNQCKIRNCKKIARCEKHISKIEKNYFKEAIDKLCSLNVLNYNQVQTNRLKELIDYRNRIHIRIDDDNEFLDDKFNLSIHKEAIKILIALVEALKDNAVPNYSKCVVKTQNSLF